MVMRPIRLLPATEPVMSYQTALQYAQAGKSKCELGRVYELAEQALCV